MRKIDHLKIYRRSKEGYLQVSTDFLRRFIHVREKERFISWIMDTNKLEDPVRDVKPIRPREQDQSVKELKRTKRGCCKRLHPFALPPPPRHYACWASIPRGKKGEVTACFRPDFPASDTQVINVEDIFLIDHGGPILSGIRATRRNRTKKTPAGPHVAKFFEPSPIIDNYSSLWDPTFKTTK